MCYGVVIVRRFARVWSTRPERRCCSSSPSISKTVGRPSNRHTQRQIDRQTDRQTDKPTPPCPLCLSPLSLSLSLSLLRDCSSARPSPRRLRPVHPLQQHHLRLMEVPLAIRLLGRPQGAPAPTPCCCCTATAAATPAAAAAAPAPPSLHPAAPGPLPAVTQWAWPPPPAPTPTPTGAILRGRHDHHGVAVVSPRGGVLGHSNDHGRPPRGVRSRDGAGRAGQHEPGWAVEGGVVLPRDSQ